MLSPSLATAPRTATLCGIVYIFPKDGNGKGTVLNINHDIVPQVIGKTLAGVSRKEYK